MNAENSGLTPVDLAREADFVLGALQVSPSSREVSRAGWKDSLEPRVMQVLVALAQADGAVVSRDDLIARCWEGRVVGEDAINRAIGRLRRLSEADGGASFIIETIARVGYRLRAGIAAAPDETPVPAAATPAKARRIVPLAAGVAALCVAGGLAWWWHRPAEWTVDSFRTVISTLLFEGSPSLDPKGGMIAYAAGASPYASHIYLRNLSGGAPIEFTSGVNDNDMNPVWSPSGDRVAFIRHIEGEPCAIIVKPVPAGDERIVGRCRMDDFSALTWAPDSDTLYFQDRPDRNAVRRIVKLDIASGQVSQVTRPPDGISGDTRPAISPDGRRMTFFRTVKGNWTRMVMDLQSGAETALTKIPGYAQGQDWLDNDNLLITMGGLSEPALWLYPLDGEPVRLQVYPQPFGRLARGPNRTFATETGQDRVLLASPPAKEGGEPEILQRTSGVTMFPEYARDGQLVFAHASPGGSWEIWVQKPGTAARQITAISGGYFSGLRWSPDGKRLAFFATIGERRGIFTINADGTSLDLFSPQINAGPPAWSGDGRALLYPIKEEQGWRIWRAPLANAAQAKPITDFGWFAVRTSGDAIYALGTKESGVWRLDGKPRFAAQLQRRCTDAFLECNSWFVSGNTLVFADHTDRNKPRLVLQDLANGARRSVDAPGLSYADLAAMDPVSGKLLYVYDGLSDSDIAVFQVGRK